ncbi:uncharacterized protein ASPGLDRAFT_48523 [Aspergillus glaucus CBS 516.65]|uniref:Uncharacterized protein n=1 Tax=Aspergillus glaucus CBS 516.65 TaxID=1160497 RepID=A0A1L9VH01_ASPGL|nr:hypothetical protein ASPGLDRAFT_48523 [Aspergillus glaucus CBS 516.65]OJJ83142.1 hypothetical protein ASPGLDRAFT_48523 [Aspergillus glaucus CBS 516.65]
MELVSTVNQKIAYWEKKSLKGAASLGKDIRTLVLNFSKNLVTGHLVEAEENHQPPPSENNNYAEAAKKTPNAPKAHPKIPKTPYKALQQEKPPPASSYTSLRITQPAELAHTPPWTS